MSSFVAKFGLSGLTGDKGPVKRKTSWDCAVAYAAPSESGSAPVSRRPSADLSSSSFISTASDGASTTKSLNSCPVSVQHGPLSGGK
uniref:Uncharacterized protein n=1 Tax=Chromera velia CCMP2878 TaxID=1169474 RepID=A0A0G4IDZ5_9ALVE|eukprot:Cvel_13556.t1-p1 / transcript=Cvel_13556.t1 / gene=Cvel_13556 / organism=Chromera_velia_CCMP2878 / gene_product=hypothetical protein / transcript_product=hypothetical protein / location=Cvel_scaffold931:32989-33717(-) / protein_length=86 / sequence_SO=supercontig / SO=protein_coding / is_pseudo=false